MCPVVFTILPHLARLGRADDERGLEVDHSTIGGWVLRYAPELNKRVRRQIRPVCGQNCVKASNQQLAIHHDCCGRAESVRTQFLELDGFAKVGIVQ